MHIINGRSSSIQRGCVGVFERRARKLVREGGVGRVEPKSDIMTLTLWAEHYGPNIMGQTLWAKHYEATISGENIASENHRARRQYR